MHTILPWSNIINSTYEKKNFSNTTMSYDVLFIQKTVHRGTDLQTGLPLLIITGNDRDIVGVTFVTITTKLICSFYKS